MPGHGRGYACSRASISGLGSDNETMWDERTDVRRADTSVCPYMTSVYIFPNVSTRCRGGPTCPPDAGWRTHRCRDTDAEGRRSCPTNANRCVARNAPPAGMWQKRETTLKRSNGWQERALTRFDRLRGRRSCVVRAAGVASRHAAVIYCGTVSPSGLTMCPPDADTCVGMICMFLMDYPCLMNHIVDAGQTHRSAST